MEGQGLQAGRNIHHRHIFASQCSLCMGRAHNKQLGMAKITQHGAILLAKGFNAKRAVRIGNILGADIILATVIFRYILCQRHEACFWQGREAKKTRIDGKTKTRLHTPTETGLPDRPKKGMFCQLAAISGLPGRMAIRQKSISAALSAIKSDAIWS